MAKHLINFTGPKMQQYLKSKGIEARQVVQRRTTGYYVAEFYHQKMEEPIPSSQQWADAIETCLEDSTIIDSYDTVADWRPGKPVVWASVTFSLKKH